MTEKNTMEHLGIVKCVEIDEMGYADLTVGHLYIVMLAFTISSPKVIVMNDLGRPITYPQHWFKLVIQ